VVFGTVAGVHRVLAATGGQINTAFSARRTLDLRPHVAAIGRRGTTRCTGEDGWRHQRAWVQMYHTWCLPHASWRQPLPQPQPITGTGSATPWRPGMPAIAAGVPNRVWTLREVLLFRVPPWLQPQTH
jgi:hypothetical protein